VPRGGQIFTIAVAAIALSGCAQAGRAPDAVGGGGSATAAKAAPVRYADVQRVFDASCTVCHPAVNASLDLTAAKSYASLVGVRAVEDPQLVRVIAGDPDRSFLYRKIAGSPGLGSDPGIGGRMPQGQGPLPRGQVDLIRRWIAAGAPGPDGRTHSANEVATPGSIPAFTGAAAATNPVGSGTIQGTVTDDRHAPIAGAIVTELLTGAGQPQGEEHYRAAITDASGRFRLDRAAVGRLLLKAYAPRRIYTSRIVEVAADSSVTVDFGLATDALSTPTISNPKVTGAGGRATVSVDVAGTRLDRNYTLAVNPASGRVVEMHAPGAAETPGTWTATVAGPASGRWIFLAVDHGCNSSPFLTAG
jgi:hypothetical protein